MATSNTIAHVLHTMHPQSFPAVYTDAPPAPTYYLVPAEVEVPTQPPSPFVSAMTHHLTHVGTLQGITSAQFLAHLINHHLIPATYALTNLDMIIYH